MPNRFYRPSTPQYTSQFVEDKYPHEQMLVSQRYKAAKKEQIASQYGQLEALNASITAGGRTEDIAPAVKNYWNKKLADSADKMSGMSMQESTRALSRLKNEWMNDPNIQAIQRDRTEGDPELARYKQSKTFGLDVKPWWNKEEGRPKQFGYFGEIPGVEESVGASQGYTGYKPPTSYSDFEQSVLNKLKLVKPRSSKISKTIVKDPQTGEYLKDPITGLPTRRQMSGSINILDEGVFKDPIKEITEDLMEGKTQEANYMKSKWEEEGRPWTKETVGDYVKDISKVLYDQDDQTVQQDRPMTASELKALDINTEGAGTMPTRAHPTPGKAQTINIEKPGIVTRLVNVHRWFQGLDPLDPDIEQDRSFQNVVAVMQGDNPELTFDGDREARKAVKEYGKKYMEKDEYDSLKPFTIEERKEEQILYGGEETSKGFLKSNVIPALMMDARIVDVSDPDKDDVTDKERIAFTKEGQTFTTKGILGATNRWGPGYRMFTAGDKDYAYSPTDQEKEPYRLAWNLGGWKRGNSFNTVAHDDVSTKAEHFKFYGRDAAGNYKIVDRENTKTQSYHGPYFTIVPRQDHRPVDDNGQPAKTGRFVIDVYKYEPSKENLVSSISSMDPDMENIVGAWVEFEKHYEELAEKYLGNNQ